MTKTTNPNIKRQLTVVCTVDAENMESAMAGFRAAVREVFVDAACVSSAANPRGEKFTIALMFGTERNNQKQYDVTGELLADIAAVRDAAKDTLLTPEEAVEEERKANEATAAAKSKRGEAAAGLVQELLQELRERAGKAKPDADTPTVQ